MEDRLRRIAQLSRTGSETDEDTGRTGELSKKRTVEDRSPQVDIVRSSRIRMDEFDIGEKFGEVSKGLRTEVEKLIDSIGNPELQLEGLKTAVRLGLESMVGHMEAIMSAISDMESQERRQREADMMRVDDKVGKLMDKVTDVDCCCVSLIKDKVDRRNKESRKEMETKLVESMGQFKIMDISFGRHIEDKGEIARLAVEIVRQDVRQTEIGQYNDIMRRSRISVLGKSTVRRDSGSGEYFTVPVLVSCKDRNEKWDLEGIVRRAGYFPSFHWPKEMMEFVRGARKEVQDLGFTEDLHYVRIRPEIYEGRVQIRADVKPKAGGTFRPKAVWNAPPLCTDYWAQVKNLLKPRIIGSVSPATGQSGPRARLAQQPPSHPPPGGETPMD